MTEREKLQPRARYFGDEASRYYHELNADFFSLPLLDALAQPQRVVTSSDQVIREHYLAHGNEQDIDQMVKIIPLPVCIPPELSRGAIREVRSLRDQEVLTALRGGRRTDLARPLKPDVRQILKESCPHLVEIITKVEKAIEGGELFIRAVKFDEARASTTQKEDDRLKGNLHFDAEKSTLEQYSDQVYQFYVNVSRLPRQFRIIPVPLPQMLEQLDEKGILAKEAHRTTPLEEVLRLYVENCEVVYEQIIIESGQLAIFDGRMFAHDAGKGRMRNVRRGEFAPSSEPDLLIALDTRKTGYHIGNYDPDQSLLEDSGTDAWWEMMAKYEKKS